MTKNQYEIMMETMEALTAEMTAIKSLLTSNMAQINRLFERNPVNPVVVNPVPEWYGRDPLGPTTNQQIEIGTVPTPPRGHTELAGLGRDL